MLAELAQNPVPLFIPVAQKKLALEARNAVKQSKPSSSTTATPPSKRARNDLDSSISLPPTKTSKASSDQASNMEQNENVQAPGTKVSKTDSAPAAGYKAKAKEATKDGSFTEQVPITKVSKTDQPCKKQHKAKPTKPQHGNMHNSAPAAAADQATKKKRKAKGTDVHLKEQVPLSKTSMAVSAAQPAADWTANNSTGHVPPADRPASKKQEAKGKTTEDGPTAPEKPDKQDRAKKGAATVHVSVNDKGQKKKSQPVLATPEQQGGSDQQVQVLMTAFREKYGLPLVAGNHRLVASMQRKRLMLLLKNGHMQLCQLTGDIQDNWDGRMALMRRLLDEAPIYCL